MQTPSRQLSLVLITKNEARCLARCLQSVRQIVDEIVVTDTGSTDNTVNIARQFGAKIAHFKWEDDFSAARNFALKQAVGDWMLVLDADEFASQTLAQEIRAFIQREPAIGVLRVVSDFRQQNQILQSQGFVARLFPRGIEFSGRIHEQIASPLPRLLLNGELWHDGYLETNKSDRNIKLLLRELEISPENRHYLFQLAVEYTSLNRTRDAFNCLEKVVSNLHFNDSFAPNAAVDYLRAAMDLKEFNAGLKLIAAVRARLDDFPDFHFACGLFYMNLVRSDPERHASLVPEIERSFLRCLAIGDTIKYRSVRGAGSFLASYNLGLLYHVFNQSEQARGCFERAAKMGYEPAARLLAKPL